jgi:hypothetical protein
MYLPWSVINIKAKITGASSNYLRNIGFTDVSIQSKNKFKQFQMEVEDLHHHHPSTSLPMASSAMSTTTTAAASNVVLANDFTLSPEMTDCDSADLESEMSINEGSYHSSGPRMHTSMPVLEDGLSSGHASDLEDDVIYSR